MVFTPSGPTVWKTIFRVCSYACLAGYSVAWVNYGLAWFGKPGLDLFDPFIALWLLWLPATISGNRYRGPGWFGWDFSEFRGCPRWMKRAVVLTGVLALLGLVAAGIVQRRSGPSGGFSHGHVSSSGVLPFFYAVAGALLHSGAELDARGEPRRSFVF